MTDSFPIGRAAYALGFSTGGKAKALAVKVLSRDGSYLEETGSVSIAAVAKAAGVHNWLMAGAMNPYPLETHKSIVRVMRDDGVAFRKAAKSLGLIPARAAMSMATDAEGWRAVIAAHCLPLAVFANNTEYQQALTEYLG
jgi:hypothetical protein